MVGGPQEWFDAYFAQALELQAEYEQEELIEKFPAACVLLKLTGHMNILPNWGISLEARNATPEGASIILTQTGGYLSNRLFYGSDYYLQKYENDQWADVEPLTELIWTTVAYAVPLDGAVTWNIHWADTFGTLEPGLYRFCKGISDHRAPGETDYAVYCAEFEIS